MTEDVNWAGIPIKIIGSGVVSCTGKESIPLGRAVKRLRVDKSSEEDYRDMKEVENQVLEVYFGEVKKDLRFQEKGD